MYFPKKSKNPTTVNTKTDIHIHSFRDSLGFYAEIQIIFSGQCVNYSWVRGSIQAHILC